MIKNNASLLLCLALIFYRPFNGAWGTVWVEKFGIVVFFAGFLIIDQIKLHLIHKITLLYFLLMSSLSGFVGKFHWKDPYNFLPSLEHATNNQFLVFMVFLLLLSKKIRLPYLGRALEFAGIIVLLGIISGWFCRIDTTLYVPLIHNPSMACTFLVMSLHPALSLIGILFTKSWAGAISWGVLVMWRLKENKIKSGRNALLVLCSLLLIGLAVYIRGFGDSGHGYFGNGRFSFWMDYLRWWWGSGWKNIVVGPGPGTTRFWLPYTNFIFHGSKPVVDVFVWAHNDFLQELIETGVVGLSLVLLSGIRLFRMANDKQRGLLLAYGSLMMMNFPWHWAITCLTGWNLILEVHNNARHWDTA